ncbi:MAG: hypothetical protein HKP61_13580, partial [Dactylosporangium sp.]|nr:glycosyltransferase family 39 protein [Dactylosporangium sp.]NNJ61945.1 hypothetical protein [Dactylosporangium sp.]
MSDERNAHLVGPEAGLAKSGPASASARWALACRRLLTGWWWPTVLMLGLSLWRIGTPAAWNDELATWGAVREPWDNLLALSWHSDAVITPYYLVLHLWALAFGTSDAALRIPSAMAIVVACALVTRLGIRLHSRHAGIVAGLLFALTPSMSRVAQEARVYAFVIMFAALATLLLLRVLERPSAAWLTAYGVSVAALGLAHLMGLFLLLAHAGAVVAAWILASPPGPKPPGSRPPGPKPPAPKPLTLTWRWAAACVVGCLPAVPLALAGRSQSGQIGWIPPSSAGALLDLVTGLTRSTAVGGLVVGLAIAHRLHRRAGVLVLGWAVLPVAGLFAAGLVFPVFLSRYLLFVLPAWLLLGATAVARPPAWRP